jgi:CPA1 family monovalent cation:H+ antiporter
LSNATAIVTYQIILAVIAVGVLDGWTIITGIGNFFTVFFGGLLVGLALGFTLIRAIPLIADEPIVHLTFTLVIAYGAFIIAEHFLHTSGIMAVLGAGLVIGYYRPLFQRVRSAAYLEIFWENAAFIANSLIFLMLGLSEKVFLTYTPSNIEGLLIPVLTAIAIVLLARAVVIYTLIPLVNAIPGAKPISLRYRAVLAWGGLRGAVAVALAMSLPPHFPYRWQIIDLTFGITLFMLVFNGATMSWVMRRLKLDKPAPELEFMHAYATAAAKRNALAKLDSPIPGAPVSDVVKARVKADYTQQLQQAEQHLAALRTQLGKDRKTCRKLLWLRALAILRQTYRQRYAEGLLSLSALHELEWSANNQEIGAYQNNSESSPSSLLLPSEARPEAGLLRLLQQALPRLRPLKRWQTQHLVNLHEEAATVVAACRNVLAELNYLGDLSGAASEDLENCRRYFTQMAKVAAARLEFVEGRMSSANELLHEKLLYKAASDGEKAVMGRGALSGELPEPLTEQLEQELESGR